MNFVNYSLMCQPFYRFRYLHQTVHALSARRYTNVVCWLLEIPPSKASPIVCVQGRTPVVTYRPCFERQIPQDEVLYKRRLLRAGDPTQLEYGACKGGRRWLHSASYPHQTGVLCML